MIVACRACAKTFELPDNRLPVGKMVSFPCPGCKAKITLDLRPASAQRPAGAGAAADGGAGVPPAKPDGTAQGGPPEASNEENLKQEILNRVKALPPLPQVIHKAREVMANPKNGFKQIAAVIETDQAIAAKILQAANSAYYGLSGTVSSIHQATVVLGHKTLEQLIMMVSATSLLGKRLDGYRLGAGALWQHSLSVALCSRFIARDRAPALENDAFSAGLIHDAGKLAMDPYLAAHPDRIDQALKAGTPFLELENQILGFDHTQMASDLCQKWHMPESHVSAMRFHHDPGASDGNRLAFIVHVANAVVKRQDADGPPPADLDANALSSLTLDPEDLNRYRQETSAAVDRIAGDLR